MIPKYEGGAGGGGYLFDVKRKTLFCIECVFIERVTGTSTYLAVVIAFQYCYRSSF